MACPPHMVTAANLRMQHLRAMAVGGKVAKELNHREATCSSCGVTIVLLEEKCPEGTSLVVVERESAVEPDSA